MRGVLPILVALVASVAWAGSVEDPVQIIEQPDAQAPLELDFVDETGKAVKLGDYFDGKQPVVVNFVYYQCPLLCTLMLDGVVNAMKPLDWVPGKAYRLVTLTVNPTEGPKLAAAKKKSYLGAFGNDAAGAGWAFLSGGGKNIKTFADAMGWGYRYDPSTTEYIHGAATLVLSPQGKVVRYLHGSRPGTLQLRMALLEAGVQGSMTDAVLAHLYPYDPAARKYQVSLLAVLTLSIVIALPFALALVLLGRRRRRSAGAPPASEDSDTSGLMVRGVIPNG